ncbi:src-like-adapter 2 [Papilio machaon]|uniref:src-like-adapter 2 n=1 Tax=Papilio machaon TaxID=76193 RepID=UPI001E664B21|nr:src-like-adapter 2 [Papilio machaon]
MTCDACVRVQIALEVLGAQGVGAFLVRASTTQRGCLALSLRVPRDFAHHGIAHYLILRTPKGYKIKGFTKEFASLSALVTHHSVMPELLPVPLRLPRAPRAPRPDLEPLERLAPAPRAAHPAHPARPAHPAHPHRAPLDV